MAKKAWPSASWLPSRMTCSGASSSGPVARAVGAAMNGVLPALLGARVVPPVAVAEGNRDVGLLHVAEHLPVELLAQAGQGRHHGLGIGIFGFEIGGHLGILLVAQPGVVVGEDRAVQKRLGVLLAGDGRRRKLSDILLSVVHCAAIGSPSAASADSGLASGPAPAYNESDERHSPYTFDRFPAAAGSPFRVSATAALAEQVEDLPQPTDYVSDFAHVLSPEAIARLDRICASSTTPRPMRRLPWSPCTPERR